MAGIFSLRQWVMKQLMKTDKSGIMKIPDKRKIDFGEMLVKESLFQKGINPGAIKNEKQLDNILNTPVVPKSERVKPKKPGKVIKVDFDKGRWNKAGGGRTGLSYLLAEDTNERIPLKDGYSPGRRKFLKVAAGLAALPVVGKFFKFAKPAAKVSKTLTSVPIKNIEGMPAWFKPLVNKVIKEGDDVTKKFATKEREIVHTKKLDEFDEVTVRQDLDTGNVRVEYHGSNNMGEAPIQLDYKAAEIVEPDIATGKGGGKIKEEFTAVESEPEIVNWDGDIEWTGENVVGKVDDLLSDTTKLETYATGKKPNIKKLLKSKQKQKYVNNLHDDQLEQVNYIENKEGYSPMEYIDESERVGAFKNTGPETKGMNLPNKIKKASGGIARMLGE